MLTVAVFKG